MTAADKDWQGALPCFNQELYDEWLKLQDMREKLLRDILGVGEDKQC